MIYICTAADIYTRLVPPPTHPKGLSYYLCPRVLAPRPKEAGRWLILHSWEANNSISGEAAVGGACSAHNAESLCFMASRPVYFHSQFYCFLLVAAFLCLRDNAACAPGEMICRCRFRVCVFFSLLLFFEARAERGSERLHFHMFRLRSWARVSVLWATCMFTKWTGSRFCLIDNPKREMCKSLILQRFLFCLFFFILEPLMC